MNTVKKIAKYAPTDIDYWSVRYVDEDSQSITVRRDILQPITNNKDCGVMITVYNKGGVGYAASQNFSEQAVKDTFLKAKKWAEISKYWTLFDASKLPQEKSLGSYKTKTTKPWESLSLQDKIDVLRKAAQQLKSDPRIIDWESAIAADTVHHYFVDSNGTQIEQEFHFIYPNLSATANEGSNTQMRSLGGFRALCQQSGFEILDTLDFNAQAKIIADEAIQLLLAKNCPQDTMDLLLAPDQMMLQIHESIGHPLELDRILGDERNYAGTSFVTPEMFGSYQYGSKLLNITFDPTISNQLASYAYDDDGAKAKKTFMIENGLLKTPLGGACSQFRANFQEGVANSRASSWNRPPIDRMANLNLEPGDSTFEDMVASIEKGVYMASNTSWSIDDSRNKFQFGCEWGQLIENGRLTEVVKNPNYRGVSATFWRNLAKVGNQQTFRTYGTPFCGKGEPNQCIRVGHASPACVFYNVDIFGGE